MGRSLSRRFRLGAVGLATLTAVTLLPAGAGAVERDEFAVTGLRERAELRIDRWGVPHIYASSTDDVFLAQGFNAARDRLFQIDLWHRRGLGRLSEAFGPEYVEQDRATRMFLYRGDMEREWASYGPEAKRIATQFAHGINAYLDWIDEHPDALPEEFRRLDYKPSRWQPEDVVRIRSHGLTRNLISEVQRSRVTCAAGLEADEVRKRLEPEWETKVPEGYDPCLLPDDVLDTFQLATRSVTFSKETGDVVAEPRQALDASDVEGSNNWAISGDRTRTGRPILANDPHRSHAAPSLRYLAHLSAPGLNLIGAGEPALPGVSIGHNGTVGFGLTIFPLDQEDLYVYRLDPDDRSRYRYGDGWESMRTLEEQVPVAGGEPRAVTMPFTRHGPVIKVDEENNLAYAVRTAWLQPGMSPYFGSVKFNKVRNFEQFVDAMRNWGAPTENQIYADTAGNIGWVPGGLVPKRDGYDGLMPVPGDGRYEWNGFYDGDDLPRSYNPKKGYFATANQMNLPPDFPYREKKLGFEWTNPYRFQRITEVLDKETDGTVAGSGRLQNDQLSIPARRMVAVLKEVPGTSPALSMLRKWDAVESVDSAAAALFSVWRVRHLEPAFVRAVAPKAAEHIARPDTAVLLEALEEPGKWFGANAEQKRDALVNETLAQAYAETGRLLGPDADAWQWGDLQFSLFEHPMSDALDEADRKRFNVGPLPRGGSEHTPNASRFSTTTFQHTSGASFRMVLDVGNWDSSVAINTPGQSGDQQNPHYRDLAESWSQGEYFPLSYTREAVEKNTERVVVLEPRG